MENVVENVNMKNLVSWQAGVTTVFLGAFYLVLMTSDYPVVFITMPATIFATTIVMVSVIIYSAITVTEVMAVAITVAVALIAVATTSLIMINIATLIATAVTLIAIVIFVVVSGSSIRTGTTLLSYTVQFAVTLTPLLITILV